MPATTSKPGRDLTAFTLFDTVQGRCAILWRGGLVVGAALPEPNDRALRASLARRFPGAVEMIGPAHVAAAVRGVEALLAGEAVELDFIQVGLEDVGAFDRLVLEETRKIPRGGTSTYGEIAARLGSAGAARAVGRALGANPIPIIIPCHRVLGADGRSGGFSAPGGSATKLKLLEAEGARRGSDALLFDRLPWQLKP